MQKSRSPSNGISALAGIIFAMPDLPAKVRADRLLGNRLRIGVYSGKQLNVTDFTTREYAVVWVLRGSGIFRDDRGHETPFTAGDVYQRLPGRKHSCRWDDWNTGLTCFAVVPAPFLSGLRMAHPPGLKTPVFSIGVDLDLAHRWAALAKQVRDASEADLPRQMAAVFSLVCELHVRCHHAVRRDGWLDQAQALIDGHLLDRVPMPAVLAPLGGSYASNRAKFSALCGCSPGAYRVRKRMELAQDLLASQDTSVAEIADQLGFDEPSNFSKQFRLHCGCNPGEFRAAHAL
jgi:AraC family transcriptional regulator, arabinose operon regulatory protein